MSSMTPISTAAAAELLQVSIRTIDRYIERGLLHPLYTPGGHRRFDPNEVDHLLSRPAAHDTEHEVEA